MSHILWKIKKCLKPPTSKTCQNQYCRYGPNVKSRLYKRPIRQSTVVFSKAPRGLWAFTSPSEVGDRQEIIKSLGNHMIPYEWPNSGLYPMYIYIIIIVIIIIVIYIIGWLSIFSSTMHMWDNPVSTNHIYIWLYMLESWHGIWMVYGSSVPYWESWIMGTLWLWLTWPWYRWPIEIDGLPIKNCGSFHGYVSHNHMVNEFLCKWFDQKPPRYGGLLKWGGIPKWMVYNRTSCWNGWFRGTPILGNLHMISYVNGLMTIF